MFIHLRDVSFWCFYEMTSLLIEHGNLKKKKHLIQLQRAHYSPLTRLPLYCYLSGPGREFMASLDKEKCTIFIPQL